MYRVVDVNDSGKTKKLLEECSYNHGIFVCRHPNRIVDKCAAYGIEFANLRGVYGYAEYLREYRNLPADAEIYIDELELFVNEMCDHKVKGYTLTIGA